MLVARPGKPDPTTATTPTPIGCKLLKINRLTQQKPLASSFREVRILQNFLNTATLISKHSLLAELFGTAFFDSASCVALQRGAHSTEQKRPVNTFRKTILNNCDTGKSTLPNLRNNSRVHRTQSSLYRQRAHHQAAPRPQRSGESRPTYWTTSPACFSSSGTAIPPRYRPG